MRTLSRRCLSLVSLWTGLFVLASACGSPKRNFLGESGGGSSGDAGAIAQGGTGETTAGGTSGSSGANHTMGGGEDSAGSSGDSAGMSLVSEGGGAGTSGNTGMAGIAGTAGMPACGGAESDVNHCGPTCKQCETSDPNAVPTCSNNTCTYPCVTGYQYCGFCVSKNDPANCGACGNACGSSKTCINGGCLVKDGSSCTADADCLNGKCGTYYVDADGDGFGSSTTAKVCGVSAPSGFSANHTDCCDSDVNANPNQTTYFPTADACGNFDYNCSNFAEPDPTRNQVASGVHCNLPGKSCVLDQAGWIGTIPTCGQDGTYQLNCGYYPANGGQPEGCGAGIDVAHPTQLCH